MSSKKNNPKIFDRDDLKRKQKDKKKAENIRKQRQEKEKRLKGE